MRIALIGYGKMGHMIEEIALSRGHEIVARIDANDAFDLNGAEVAIEFTTPATAKDNILRAWAQGVPVVCGTTGWDAEALRNNRSSASEKRIKNLELRRQGNKTIIADEKGKTMLVWSSNFSVGVNIFFELNKQLAAAMSEQPQYTPSITETHHIHKLDKPSGTAKTLANDIMSAAKPLNGDLLDSDGHRQSSVLNDVPIESIREGEVPGTHEVKWDSEEDTIIITHIAKGRRGFALGAVLAAEQIKK
ncbi:MAG: 4-hydroxy-tetrahydrodipicolinate reductase [Paludibacteraceae bacterium]|nr:4-hydroxy-tetrahydrodipicolinate reductase [Paludibacteraceae bacterium]